MTSTKDYLRPIPIASRVRPRAKETQSNGTDHCAANVQFVSDGRGIGGHYGEAPQLALVDGNGELPFAVDFRSMYAAVIDKWWVGIRRRCCGEVTGDMAS